MIDRIRDKNIDFLFECILKLESEEECYAFFGDNCTIAELQEMSRRLAAAKMLYEKKIYTDIAEETGLSTATISRVNRCHKNGSDGYAAILPRIERNK